MTTGLAIEPHGRAPGRSASRAYRPDWRSPYGWVEGIVTMGTVIGFTLALASMAGVWLGGQLASLTQTMATAVAQATAPTVAAGPAIEPCTSSRPL